MTPTRKAKGRDDLVHLLRQVHHTDIRNVTERVAMTEVPNAHQNALVEVRQEKRTDYFVQATRKDVANGDIHVMIGIMIGMFPCIQH